MNYTSSSAYTSCKVHTSFHTFSLHNRYRHSSTRVLQVFGQAARRLQGFDAYLENNTPRFSAEWCRGESSTATVQNHTLFFYSVDDCKHDARVHHDIHNVLAEIYRDTGRLSPQHQSGSRSLDLHHHPSRICHKPI